MLKLITRHASEKVRPQMFTVSVILSHTLSEYSSQSPSEEYWMAKSIYWMSHDFLRWPSHSLDEWCGESVMCRPQPMWYLPTAAQTHVCQPSQTLHYLFVCCKCLPQSKCVCLGTLNKHDTLQQVNLKKSLYCINAFWKQYKKYARHYCKIRYTSNNNNNN